MESIVFEDSPLAAYLEGEGRDEQEWAASQDEEHPSTLMNPSFAPRGKPKPKPMRSKFRSKLPHPLRLTIPQNPTVAAIQKTCSSFQKAVDSHLGGIENARFLEQFRYVIVASQLLSEHFRHAQPSPNPADVTIPPPSDAVSITGAVATACASFISVWMIHWARVGPNTQRGGKGRVALVLVLLGSVAMVSYAYVRRQWLQYLRQRALEEIQGFVSKSHEYNSSTSTAITLIQEVELISRGYRISAPLPPISRLEDRSQTRRCARLRRSLATSLTTATLSYQHACDVIKPLAAKNDLEKYFDIYDVSDADVQETGTDLTAEESDDLEALKTLKILAARFHLIRKILLCCLLALDADGSRADFTRWSTAVGELETIGTATEEADEQLRSVLSETEDFPVSSTPAKGPLSPGRERWRAQLRKLNSLSSGIRGLQAKLQVLREESDNNLNESEDVAEMGNDLMVQYESIGLDLKALMQEWEAGKAALANNIDRNEKRISAMSSGLLSPAMSWGGLTSVDESNNSPSGALKILNGDLDISSSSCSNGSDVEEVFEAVALPPRNRSSLTREERIAKMREEREKRASVREKSDANTNMLRELESVINLRPKGRNSLQPESKPGNQTTARSSL